jgi:HEAT repeat protein
VTALAQHPEPAVRDWAIWASLAAIGSPAIPLLEKLALDADPDVRSEAMRALVKIDRAWARKLIPRYLHQLESHDFVEARDAIWRLTQWRDEAARPIIENLAISAAHPVVRANAGVAVLVYAADEDALINGLEASDDDHTNMWTLGLAYLGTQRAITTLQQLAERGTSEHRRRLGLWGVRAAERSKPLISN